MMHTIDKSDAWLTSIKDLNAIKLAEAGLHVDRVEGECHSVVQLRRQRPDAHQIVSIAVGESWTGQHSRIAFRNVVLPSTDHCTNTK